MEKRTIKTGDERAAQTRWAAGNVGKHWQLVFFKAVIAIGGRGAAYHIMYLVVLWYVIFNPDIRRRTRFYLDRRFPRRRCGPGALWDSYRMVCSFGHVLIDQAALAISGPGVLEAACTNEKALKEAAGADKGLILLVSHLGCWQIAMSALGFLQKPVSAVMLPQGEDSPVTRMIREKLPFSIIDPRNGIESVLCMMQALGKGEILTIMGDRVFGSGRDRISAPFLGRDICLPASPYRLAEAAGAEILVLHAARIDPGRYEITLSRVIKPDKSTENMRTCARMFAETLEEFVEKHPYQFFNFFDLWDASDRS